MKASSAVLKKVKLIELKMRKKVRDLFAGGYHSAFKGHGMVFSDYRQYTPGDDIRSISWPLTAKLSEPYIKIFEEEKGATFLIMMDVSGSFDFGSLAFKAEMACEIASLITMSVQRSQDAVGLLLFSDRVEHYVPPARGNKNGLRILRDLYVFERKSAQTNLRPALEFLNKVLKKRCHIFIFSDFCTSVDFKKQLDITGRRHDVVAGFVQDPFEACFPPLGLIEVEDRETGNRTVVDSSSPSFLRSYEESARVKRESIKKILQGSSVDYFLIETHKDMFIQLMKFIKQRKAK